MSDLDPEIFRRGTDASAQRHRDEYRREAHVRYGWGERGEGVDRNRARLLREGYSRGLLNDEQRAEYMRGLQEGYYQPVLNDELSNFQYRVFAREDEANRPDEVTGLSRREMEDIDRRMGGRQTALARLQTAGVQTGTGMNVGLSDAVAGTVARTGLGRGSREIEQIAERLKANGYQGDPYVQAARILRGEMRRKNPGAALAGDVVGFIGPGAVGAGLMAQGGRAALAGLGASGLRTAAAAGTNPTYAGVIGRSVAAWTAEGAVYGATVGAANRAADKQGQLTAEEYGKGVLTDTALGLAGGALASPAYRTARAGVTKLADSLGISGAVSKMFRLKDRAASTTITSRWVPRNRAEEIDYENAVALGFNGKDVVAAQMLKQSDPDLADKSITDILQSDRVNALRVVETALRESGVTAQNVYDELQLLQHNNQVPTDFLFSLMLQAGRATEQGGKAIDDLVTALTTVGGEFKSAAPARLRQRRTETLQALRRDIQDATGVDINNFRPAAEAVAEGLQRQSNRLYKDLEGKTLSDADWARLNDADDWGETFFDREYNQDAAKLASQLADQVSQFDRNMLPYAKRLRQIVEDIEIAKGGDEEAAAAALERLNQKPDIPVLNMIDQAFTELKGATDKPRSTGALKAAQQRNRQILDGSNDTYGMKAARNSWKLYRDAEEAMEDSFNFFKRTGDIDDLMERYEYYKGREGGKEIGKAILIGVARAADQEIKNMTNMGSAGRVFGGSINAQEKFDLLARFAREELADTPAERAARTKGRRKLEGGEVNKKLRNLDGSQQDKRRVKLRGRIQQINEMIDQERRFFGGSQTASRQEAMDALDAAALQDWAAGAVNIINGNPSGGILKGVEFFVKKAFGSKARRSGVNKQLANLLYETDPARIKGILQDIERLAKATANPIGRNRYRYQPIRFRRGRDESGNPPSGGGGGGGGGRSPSGQASDNEVAVSPEAAVLAKGAKLKIAIKSLGPDVAIVSVGAGLDMANASLNESENNNIGLLGAAGIVAGRRALQAGRALQRNNLKKRFNVSDVDLQMEATAQALKDMNNRGAGNSFVGQGAATAPRSKLIEADQMLKSGKSMMQVYEETGWFVAPDGKWRYSMSDKDVPYTPPARVGDAGKIGDVMPGHPALRAYPELADRVTIVEQKFSDPRDLGQMAIKRDSTTGVSQFTITVNSNLPEQVRRRTALHEMQHVIQDHAGLNQGYSPDAALYQIKSRTNNQANARGLLAAIRKMSTPENMSLDKNGFRNGFLQAFADAVHAQPANLRPTMQSFDNFIDLYSTYIDLAFDKIAQGSDQTQTLREFLSNANVQINPHLNDLAPITKPDGTMMTQDEIYERVYGEVEARIVEKMDADPSFTGLPTNLIDVPRDEILLTRGGSIIDRTRRVNTGFESTALPLRTMRSRAIEGGELPAYDLRQPSRITDITDDNGIYTGAQAALLQLPQKFAGKRWAGKTSLTANEWRQFFKGANISKTAMKEVEDALVFFGDEPITRAAMEARLIANGSPRYDKTVLSGAEFDEDYEMEIRHQIEEEILPELTREYLESVQQSGEDFVDSLADDALDRIVYDLVHETEYIMMPQQFGLNRQSVFEALEEALEEADHPQYKEVADLENDLEAVREISPEAADAIEKYARQQAQDIYDEDYAPTYDKVQSQILHDVFGAGEDHNISLPWDSTYPEDDWYRLIDERMGEMRANGDLAEGNTVHSGVIPRHMDASEGYEEHLIRFPEGTPGSDWQHSHWGGIDGVMGWYRRGRYEIEGQDTDFVIEIQSDFHQRGRRYGYRLSKDEADEKRRIAQEKLDTINRQIDDEANSIELMTEPFTDGETRVLHTFSNGTEIVAEKLYNPALPPRRKHVASMPNNVRTVLQSSVGKRAGAGPDNVQNDDPLFGLFEYYVIDEVKAPGDGPSKPERMYEFIAAPDNLRERLVEQFGEHGEDTDNLVHGISEQIVHGEDGTGILRRLQIFTRQALRSESNPKFPEYRAAKQDIEALERRTKSSAPDGDAPFQDQEWPTIIAGDAIRRALQNSETKIAFPATPAMVAEIEGSPAAAPFYEGPLRKTLQRLAKQMGLPEPRFVNLEPDVPLAKLRAKDVGLKEGDEIPALNGTNDIYYFDDSGDVGGVIFARTQNSPHSEEKTSKIITDLIAVDVNNDGRLIAVRPESREGKEGIELANRLRDNVTHFLRQTPGPQGVWVIDLPQGDRAQAALDNGVKLAGFSGGPLAILGAGAAAATFKPPQDRRGEQRRLSEDVRQAPHAEASVLVGGRLGRNRVTTDLATRDRPNVLGRDVSPESSRASARVRQSVTAPAPAKTQSFTALNTAMRKSPYSGIENGMSRHMAKRLPNKKRATGAARISSRIRNV